MFLSNTLFKDGDVSVICSCVFWNYCLRFSLGVLYKHQDQQEGQGAKQQSQREGESETVTKGGSRIGIPLNEGEVVLSMQRR